MSLDKDHLQASIRRRYAQDNGRSAYFWECHKHGLVVIAEFDLFEGYHYLTELPDPPYELHARSYRSTEGLLTHMSVPIEPGMEPIWRHRHSQIIGVDFTEHNYDESLLFGRRHPNGLEEVRRVYPDAFFVEFKSLQAAEMYVRPSNKPEKFQQGAAHVVIPT